jgi:hypothetical protein
VLQINLVRVPAQHYHSYRYSTSSWRTTLHCSGYRWLLLQFLLLFSPMSDRDARARRLAARDRSSGGNNPARAVAQAQAQGDSGAHGDHCDCCTHMLPLCLPRSAFSVHCSSRPCSVHCSLAYLLKFAHDSAADLRCNLPGAGAAQPGNSGAGGGGGGGDARPCLPRSAFSVTCSSRPCSLHCSLAYLLKFTHDSAADLRCNLPCAGAAQPGNSGAGGGGGDVLPRRAALSMQIGSKGHSQWPMVHSYQHEQSWVRRSQQSPRLGRALWVASQSLPCCVNNNRPTM